jgi:hypothetical protein
MNEKNEWSEKHYDDKQYSSFLKVSSDSDFLADGYR